VRLLFQGDGKRDLAPVVKAIHNFLLQDIVRINVRQAVAGKKNSETNALLPVNGTQIATGRP